MPRNLRFAGRTKGAARLVDGKIPREPINADVEKRSDAGAYDKDEDAEHDGVGPGVGHEFVGDQSEPHQHEHYYGQFKAQPKAEGEPRYERIILLHRPGRGPAERLRVVKKEKNRFGEQPKIANKHASKKKRKADADGREQDFLLQ